MSMSAGAGSPLFFMCSVARKNKWRAELHHRDPRMGHRRIVRTGRSRPYRPPRGSALGLRSLLTAYEYKCECGHTGWSNHYDVKRLEEVTT